MVENHIGSRNSAQIRSHAQKFLNKIDRDGNKDHEDIREVLQVNLRSLKKVERPVHKNIMKTLNALEPVQIKAGLNISEFREKYTLYPYQKLFETEKLDNEE